MKTEWQILYVALGGALGAISRFGISNFFDRWLKHPFPVGTLIANILGCFLIGLLIGSGTHERSHSAKLGIGVGFLGAMTTFSAFSAETFKHFDDGNWPLAFGNVTANVVFSLLAVFLGMAAGRKLLS